MLVFVSVGMLAISLIGAMSFPTQAQTTVIKLVFRNLCRDHITIQQVALQRGMAFSLLRTNKALAPGERWEIQAEANFQPEKLSLLVVIGRQTLKATISPIPYGTPVVPRELQGCLEVTAFAPGMTGEAPGPTYPPTQPTPPTHEKPITPGMNLDQVLSTLRARGIQIREEGSKDRPKLAGVDDPMLLRAINGFSAHLIWVSAPGSLRSVILWDNPAVDLDLIVFGLFPFGFCFQLTPPGILAELCDRAPFGPVSGSVFAVIVINWTPQTQAYVLSLSS